MPLFVIIVMGPSGVGKTTVGKALARTLGWAFLDADEVHSAQNIRKMERGVPLTDDDRVAWLAQLRAQIEHSVNLYSPLVIACSALRRSYRAQLRVDANAVRFVYLKASRELLQQRLQTRPGHFMKAPMLDSQLAVLEEPREALVLDAALPVDTIVSEIQSALLD